MRLDGELSLVAVVDDPVVCVIIPVVSGLVHGQRRRLNVHLLVRPAETNAGSLGDNLRVGRRALLPVLADEGLHQDLDAHLQEIKSVGKR